MSGSFSSGNMDILIMKLDSNGNVTWAKTYGESGHDEAHSVQQTSDGGYVVGGVTTSFSRRMWDILIMKLDSDGNVTWAKVYGWASENIVYSIQQTSDGGYVVAGYTNTFSVRKIDILIMKLDSDGNVSWAKTYGGSEDDWAVSIQQTSDGGYVVGWEAGSLLVMVRDFYFAKIDANGNISWMKAYSVSTPILKWIYSIQHTLDGNYIIGGQTFFFDPVLEDFVMDILIMKLDSNGNIPGGKCDFLKETTTPITDKLVTPTVSNATLAVFTATPLVTSPSLNVTSPNPSTSTICESPIFTINASAGTGGSISPNATVSINYGTSQTFTITPDSGYKIKDVKVDGASVGAVSTYTFENITQDHKIEVEFEPITFTISASANSGGSISPNATVSVNYGTSQTFTITPDSGYKIKDVKVDGTSVGAVSTYTFENITQDHKIEVEFEKEITQTLITLQIGSNYFKVNSEERTLDSPPVIKNNRTLVPIRAIIEALGGSIGWDPSERKVTIALKDTVIDLWIGKSIAKVNGIDTPIDATNSKVVPEIINGRTMLPLRFVTESLGCDVQWDGTTRTITITYPKL